MDRTKSLCLACSASLPPLKSGSVNDILFTTKCCQRPICPTCITSNPRLSRYDPCLACLGGVSVVAASSTSGSHWASGATSLHQKPWSPEANMGAFILGDDDEDEVGVEVDEKLVEITDNRDAAESAKNEGPVIPVLEDPPFPPSLLAQEPSRILVPYKYYLNRSDTLQGLSLRFGVNVHEICKLNNLPPSILRTTPHLLHTRAFLILPPSAKPHPSLIPGSPEDKNKEDKLVRERAVKKLQTLTKEVDWRIARAYVALADDEQEQELFASKRKEMAPRSPAYTGSTLETLAIEQYLDDLEWEAEEMRAGRDVKFHFAHFEEDVLSRKEISTAEEVIRSRLWWPWSSR